MTMYLEREQIVVRPPLYRLFEHIFVAISLAADGPPHESGHSARIKLSIGMLALPGLVEAETESFPLDSVPGMSRVRGIWDKPVVSRTVGWSFGYVLVLHLHYPDGLGLEFFFEEGSMSRFQVNLGDLRVQGVLPQPFNFLEYFGETSKLED